MPDCILDNLDDYRLFQDFTALEFEIEVRRFAKLELTENIAKIFLD